MQDGTYWLVVNDEYSRFKNVSSLRSVSMDATQPVLEGLFSVLGSPLSLKSDNGAPFNSGRFASFASDWGFKHIKITPLWPRANAEAEAFMKQLGKVLKTAAMTGANKFSAAQAYTRAYNDTPHSTTQVAPNMLLLGYGRSSGLPRVESAVNGAMIQQRHERAKLNDYAAKNRMKREYDERMRAREPDINIGDQVLIKLTSLSKSTPSWDPDPYVVTSIKGSMITATRAGASVTRNSSFFKVLVGDFEEEEVEEEQPVDRSTALARTVSPRRVSFAETSDGTEEEAIQDAALVTSDKSTEATTSALSANVGRPTAAQALINQQKRLELYEANRAMNPPTRAQPKRSAKHV